MSESVCGSMRGDVDQPSPVVDLDRVVPIKAMDGHLAETAVDLDVVAHQRSASARACAVQRPGESRAGPEAVEH